MNYSDQNFESVQNTASIHVHGKGANEKNNNNNNNNVYKTNVCANNNNAYFIILYA